MRAFWDSDRAYVCLAENPSDMEVQIRVQVVKKNDESELFVSLN